MSADIRAKTPRQYLDELIMEPPTDPRFSQTTDLAGVLVHSTVTVSSRSVLAPIL